MIDLTAEPNELTFKNLKLVPTVLNGIEKHLTPSNEERDMENLEEFMLKIDEERFKNDEDWLLDDNEDRPNSRLDAAIYDWLLAGDTREHIVVGGSIEFPSDRLLIPDYVARSNHFTQGQYNEAIGPYQTFRLPGKSDTDSIGSLIDLEPLSDLVLFGFIEEETSDIASNCASSGDLKDSIEARSATKASNSKHTSNKSQSGRNSVGSNYSLEELLKPLDEQMDFKSSQLEIPDSIQEYFERYTLYIAECERKGMSAEEIIANAPSMTPIKKPKTYSPPISPQKMQSKSSELKLRTSHQPAPSQSKPLKSILNKDLPATNQSTSNSKAFSASKENRRFTINGSSSLTFSRMAKSSSTPAAHKARSNSMHFSNSSSVSLSNTAPKQSPQSLSQVLSPNNRLSTLQRSSNVMKSTSSNSTPSRTQSKPNNRSSRVSLDLTSAPTNHTFTSPIISPRLSVHPASMQPQPSVSPKMPSSPKGRTTSIHQNLQNIPSVGRTKSLQRSQSSKITSQNASMFVSRIPKPGFASASRQSVLLAQSKFDSQIPTPGPKSKDRYSTFLNSNDKLEMPNSASQARHSAMLEQNNSFGHHQLNRRSLQEPSSSSRKISPPMTDYSKTNPRIARALDSMPNFESRIPTLTPKLSVRHRPHQSTSSISLAYPHNPRLSMMLSTVPEFESRIPRPSQPNANNSLLPNNANLKRYSAQHQPLN